MSYWARARGEARPASDWDLAVFVTGRASAHDTLRLADAAYDLIVETGETIHPLALSEDGEGVNQALLDRIAAEGLPT